MLLVVPVLSHDWLVFHKQLFDNFLVYCILCAVDIFVTNVVDIVTVLYLFSIALIVYFVFSPLHSSFLSILKCFLGQSVVYFLSLLYF